VELASYYKRQRQLLVELAALSDCSQGPYYKRQRQLLVELAAR
jgi:hypothetical protein